MFNHLESLKDLTLSVHRLIPFSNVDGKGNRTSVFLQGCKLNCLYCHNPETRPFRSPEARQLSLFQLYHEIISAKPFIRGVTFSGGEPTLWHKKLLPLFKALKEADLTLYVDTAGFFDFDRISPLIDATDKFLFDLKGVDNKVLPLCFSQKNPQGDIALPEIAKPTPKPSRLIRHLSNLRRLLLLDKIEEIRFVYVKGFVSEDALFKTLESLPLKPDVRFKLIRVHPQGVRDKKELAPFIPTIEETEELANRLKAIKNLNLQVIF